MNSLLSLGLSNAAAATVMALGVGLVGLLLGRRPAVRHCLLIVVMLKLLTPPIWEVAVPGLDSPAEKVAAPPRATDLAAVEEADFPDAEDVVYEFDGSDLPESNQPASLPPVTSSFVSSIPWTTCLGLAWAVGSLCTLGVALRRTYQFTRLLRTAYPAAEETQAEIEALAEQMGLRRAPSAWLLDAAVSPMVWSLGWHPRLFLPASLWKGLDGSQRSMVLAHELAHLRRGDHLVRLFELVVLTLYWWLPVAWWVRRSLREAEEQCCDAWVVWAFPDDARTYAETLLDTIDFLTPNPAPEPLLASGFGRTHQLRRRLTMIMLGKTPRNLGAASTFAAISLAAILLPLSPSFGQKPQDAVKTEADVTITTTADAEVKEDVKVGVFAVDIADEAVKKDAELVTVNVVGEASVDPALVHNVVVRDFVARSDEVKEGKPSVNVSESFHLVIKNGDSVDEIQASSIPAAIKEIKEKIEKLSKEEPKGEGTKARIKALEKALEGMAKSPELKARIVKDRAMITKSDGPDHIQVRVIGKDLAKDQAGLEQLRQQLSKLQKELVEKQNEVARAQGELSKKRNEVTKLQVALAHAARGTTAIVVDGKPTRMVHVRGTKITGKDEKIQETKTKSGELNAADQKRLDSLEKSLAKLLDEVKELKKHEGGEKPK